MDQENREAGSPSPFSTEREPESPVGIETDPLAKPAPLDARALVAKMVEGGEWPEPEFLEQITARGDEAVEPLIEILRSQPRGWPAEAQLEHALALLQRLRPPTVIPALIEVVRSYAGDPGEEAADVIASYGEVVFEPLLKLALDPAVKGNKRRHALTAARRAAGADPALKARVADLLRPMLANAIERARQRLAEASALPDPDDIDESDFDDEAVDEMVEEVSAEELAEHLSEIEISRTRPYSGEILEEPGDAQQTEEDAGDDLIGEILHLVAELTSLADPLARDLIKTAYAEKMVETFFLSEKTVESVYARGGDPPWTPSDLLGSYADSYRRRLEALERRKQPPPMRSLPAQRELAPPSPPPVAAMQATIRNKQPVVGRNDPCWCGSGKKYKKCHLGKAAPA